MKKYIHIILFFFLFAGIGCADWINVEPENSVTFENYFKSEKDAQSLLFTLEIYMRDLGAPFADITEFIKDKSYSGDYLDIRLASLEPNYEIIAAADMIIDNAHRFPLKEEVIKPYVLQAYFAKAVAYFQLAMDFGEAPIIKDGQTFKKYAKSSVSEVLDEAEKWAQKALELPAYEDLKLGDLPLCKQYGSKGAATALLAKLYAWRAGVEGKEEYWSKAEELCTDIIENKVGSYGLATSPEEVCLETLYRDSRESIWELYQDTRESAMFYSSPIGSELIGFPVIWVHEPNRDSQYTVTKKTVNDLFDKADLRREAYFWHTDADSIFLKYINGKIVPDIERGKDSVIIGYDNRKIERAHLYKFRYPYFVYYDNDPTPSPRSMDQNVIKYRLADIILLRAECRVRQGKQNAVDDLNEIRRRAYVGDRKISENEEVFDYAYPNADDVKRGLDKDIQLAIFREREKELFLESHRYYDARRNGVEYVLRFMTPYAGLSAQDIEDGALYMGISPTAFRDNDLLRQNVYWNKRQQ